MVAEPPQLLRSALRVSTVSALWTAVASTAAVVVGATDATLALVAFGAIGLFDFLASVVLVVHFRGAGADRDAEHLERLALRVITIGLVAVAVATAVFSVVRLVEEQESHDSPASLVLAAASLGALTALAARKRHVATRLPSHALRADAQLTAVGAALAAVTLFGIAAAAAFGWSWADPAAALVIAAGALGLAALLWREEPVTPDIA